MTRAFATDPLEDNYRKEADDQDRQDRLDASASGQLPRMLAGKVDGDHSKTTWHLRDDTKSDE